LAEIVEELIKGISSKNEIALWMGDTQTVHQT
jgi:hypothetical protein